MKREIAISLFAAAVSLAFASGVARATDTKSSTMPPGADLAALRSEAARMVPAEVTLVKPIDSTKLQQNAQQGDQFEALLKSKVVLKDGSELPRGTMFVGTVAATENSRLALRFTQARLKDGKTIPIKALIVWISPEGRKPEQSTGVWDSSMLKVDQQNVVSGVDLESLVGDANSGVLVSKKHGAVKLNGGASISLAIDVQQSAHENQGAVNGGADHRGNAQPSIE